MKFPGPNMVCPRCGIPTNTVIKDAVRSNQFPGPDDLAYYEDFEHRQCQNPECMRTFFLRIVYKLGSGNNQEVISIEKMPSGESDWTEALKHEKVPDSVRLYYKEAIICKEAGALRAAFVMLRATLQLLIRSVPYVDNGKEEFIRENTLHKEIVKASEKFDLPDRLFDIADLQKLAGNDYAHPDKDTPEPDEKDLKDFFGWLDQIVDYLIVGPAKRDEYRDKRESKTDENAKSKEN